MLTLQQLKQKLGTPKTLFQAGSIGSGSPKRIAAVAAIITFDRRMLFIQRATHSGDPWSGDIAFVGGKIEPDDPSILEGLVRETTEELGIALDPSWLAGTLDDIDTMKQMILRPFVFLIPKGAAIGQPSTKDRPRWPVVPNHEVARVFDWDLDHLLRGDDRRTMLHPFRGNRLTLPCVKPPLQGDPPDLWGLTLMIVDNLLDQLDGRGRGLARNR